MNYFERDAGALARAARQDHEVIFRIIVMVLLSIRQPWAKVPEQFQHVGQYGASSKWLFGFKREGYFFASRYAPDLRILLQSYDGNLDALIEKLMLVPGLGLAKASFVAQMLVNDGACLDSHNLSRMGLSPKFTRIDKNVSNDLIRGRIRAYNNAWREYGDSAYWWNTWCSALVGRDFATASDVSAVHRLPLMGL